MESILAKERAKHKAINEVKAHIIKIKRSLKKFQIQGITILVSYELDKPIEAQVTTRTKVRPRLATLQVVFQDCQGWDIEVQGGEQEFVRGKGNLFCEHGLLITNISYRPTNYEAAQPVRQSYRKANLGLPSSQFSSNTSEVTPAKLKSQKVELVKLYQIAPDRHDELGLLKRKVKDAAETQPDWTGTGMDKWQDALVNLVEQIGHVQWVAQETSSPLSSPNTVFQGSEGYNREFFSSRLITQK